MNELFRTPVMFPVLQCPICHDDSIMMIGSCFSENICNKLKNNRFKVVSNPSGIVYNPISIVQIVNRILECRKYVNEDLFLHDDLWKSFDHHSSFNDRDQQAALSKINKTLNSSARLIHELDAIVITAGSAFVYELKENGRIVANCQKIDNSRFIRRILSIDEIINAFSSMIQSLLEINRNLRVIFTVSPVRHLRDNAHENCVSKAHLAASVYALEKKFSQVYYFPAFEIMMDELRDYRFYASDMLHPSDIAVEFIWDRFCRACISNDSADFIKSYELIINARNHRIQNWQKDKIHAFVTTHCGIIATLNDKFPRIDLTDDYRYFQSIDQ